jgi:hypothetical protein
VASTRLGTALRGVELGLVPTDERYGTPLRVHDVLTGLSHRPADHVKRVELREVPARGSGRGASTKLHVLLARAFAPFEGENLVRVHDLPRPGVVEHAGALRLDLDVSCTVELGLRAHQNWTSDTCCIHWLEPVATPNVTFVNFGPATQSGHWVQSPKPCQWSTPLESRSRKPAIPQA